MKTIYRLEDKDGNGPFFFRNGESRAKPSVRFDDDGIYGFTDQFRFCEPSYVEFLNDDRFFLYEIAVSSVNLETKRGQVVFDERAVLYRKTVDKSVVL